MFPITIVVQEDGTTTVTPSSGAAGGGASVSPEALTVTADAQRKVTDLSGESIDAHQDVINNWYNALRWSATKMMIGQYIAAPPVAPVVAIEVSLVRMGTLPAGHRVWLELHDASGSVLSTSASIDPNTVSQTESLWHRFEMPGAPQPIGPWRIVVLGDYPVSQQQFLLVGGKAADVFAGGQAEESDGTTWGPATAYTAGTIADMGFRVWVAASFGWTEPDPPLTYQITSGALAPGDALTGALVRAPGDLPGTYPITAGTLAAPAGYALTVVGAALTVAERPSPVLSGTSVLLAGQSNAVNGRDAIAAWLAVPATASHGGQSIAGWAAGQSYWTEIESGLNAHPEIQALVWWQGESDAGASLVGGYEAALQDLLARVRVVRPGLPVVIVSIGPPHQDFEEPARTTIWEIQRAVGSEPGNTFVDVTSVGHTGQHCTPEGYERAAYFVARTLGVVA